MAPSDVDFEFAEMDVEIHSAKEIDNASVTDFALIDKDGMLTQMKHMVSAEVFYAAPVSESESDISDYLRTTMTHPWDGTLPIGTIRLRIRVALRGSHFNADNRRCRITIGPYTIEGPTQGEWPTG